MSDEKTVTLSKEEIEQIKKRTQEEADNEQPEAEKNKSDRRDQDS